MTKEKTTEENAKSATEEVKAEKVATSSKDDLASKAKEILDKKCGKFSVKQIILAVLCVIVAVLVIKGVVGIFSSDSKVPDYQVAYVDGDGNLLVNSANGKKETKISSDKSSVVYAHNTERYMLFRKNGDLYRYDKKKADDSTKIGKDVTDYGFSKNDKYVWYTNKDSELYSYKKESTKLDSDVSDVIFVTEDGVFYKKSGKKSVELYYRALSGKKDKVKITEEATSYYIAYDGKTVAYINEDDELHIFKMSGKKDTKVLNDADVMKDASRNLSSIYVKDKDKNLYLIKGTKSTKVADEDKSIQYVDADEEQILFVEDDTLYYKKGTKKDVKVGDAEDLSQVTILNGNQLYYLIRGKKTYELFYSKLSNSKATTPKSVSDEVNDIYTYDFKKGLVVFTDVKEHKGTLNIAKGAKLQKITDDVSTSGLRLNSGKDKLYFIGDYNSDKGIGTLMSTTGKKAKKLVEDVNEYDYVKDNMIYVGTGYSSKSGKFDLGCYNGRKVVKIAEGVQSFTHHPAKSKGYAIYGSAGYSSSYDDEDDDYDYDDYDFDLDDLDLDDFDWDY